MCTIPYLKVFLVTEFVCLITRFQKFCFTFSDQWFVADLIESQASPPSFTQFFCEQLVFERLFEKQGSTFKIDTANQREPYCSGSRGVIITSTMTLLKWVIKRQAPNTAICRYEIEDLHAAGTKKRNKNKKKKWSQHL